MSLEAYGVISFLLCQAPPVQKLDRAVSNKGPPLHCYTTSFRNRPVSRQASDASNAVNGLAPGINKIVSLKLSDDGYLRQEGTDVKMEVSYSQQRRPGDMCVFISFLP